MLYTIGTKSLQQAMDLILTFNIYKITKVIITLITTLYCPQYIYILYIYMIYIYIFIYIYIYIYTYIYIYIYIY
jgi:hypothetical protein